MRAEFGVCVPNFGKNLSPKAVSIVASEAEELGYESVWVTDHLLLPPTQRYPYGSILEALTTMAHVASVTEEVRVGSSVLVLPMREPVSVAKALAAIDVLSGGRVIAGFGAGWCEEEFQNIGMNFRDRGRRFDEALQLIKQLWQGGEVSFSGRYYRVAAGIFEPTPAQKGGPPIWIGGNSEHAFKRALKHGQAWHFTGITLDKLSERVSNLKQLDGFTISGRFTVDLTGKTPQVVKVRAGENRVILSGSLNQITDTIDQYLRKKVTHFVLYFGDKPVEEYVKDIETFSKEVMPGYL
ncbi:MAG: TIGR03619 family F420-dependent LLM class oxidoreductase [Candidatus Caldarchaeum sp.]